MFLLNATPAMPKVFVEYVLSDPLDTSTTTISVSVFSRTKKFPGMTQHLVFNILRIDCVDFTYDNFNVPD